VDEFIVATNKNQFHEAPSMAASFISTQVIKIIFHHNSLTTLSRCVLLHPGYKEEEMSDSIQERSIRLQKRGRPEQRKAPSLQEALLCLARYPEIFRGTSTPFEISLDLGQTFGAITRLLLSEGHLLESTETRRVRIPTRHDIAKAKSSRSGDKRAHLH
jgi:hypothetical protein